MNIEPLHKWLIQLAGEKHDHADFKSNDFFFGHHVQPPTKTKLMVTNDMVTIPCDFACHNLRHIYFVCDVASTH